MFWTINTHTHTFTIERTRNYFKQKCVPLCVFYTHLFWFHLISSSTSSNGGEQFWLEFNLIFIRYIMMSRLNILHLLLSVLLWVYTVQRCGRTIFTIYSLGIRYIISYYLKFESNDRSIDAFENRTWMD